MKKYIIAAVLTLGAFTMAQGQTEVDRTKAPKPAPAPEIKIEDPQTFTLDNGLQVILVENHKKATISWRLFVDYGAIMEGDKAGYISMFGDALSAGTKNMKKAEIDEAIDFIGANIFFFSKGFYASSITKHKEKMLDILSDIMYHPTFPEEEIEKLKKKAISNKKNEKSSAESLASNVASRVKYGENHPYGEISSVASLESITSSDFKSFYSTYFKPNISYLVIVGDITLEQAKEDVKNIFGDWKKGDVQKPTYNTPKSPEGNKVVFVEKPGAVQSVINVTYPVELKPGSEDELKVKVANSILGGGIFSGRLMQNLREDKGYTYGVRSYLSSDEYIGTFGTSGSYRNEVTDSSIVEILKELKRIATEPVSEEELDLTLKSMNGQFSRSLESPQTVANFALNQFRYNLPDDYYKNYLGRLEAITVDDVLEASSKYIKPENAYIVVAGNADIKDKLQKFSYDKKIDERNHLGAPKMALKPFPEGVTAEEIVNAYVYKIFDTDNEKKIKKKIKKTKSKKQVMTTEMQGMPIEIIQYEAQPNKTATEFKMNGTVMQKQYFNGKEGGASGMGGSKPMSEEEVAKAKENKMFSEVFFKEDGVKLEALGIEDIDGKEYYKIKQINGENEELVWYGVESKLKYKDSKTQETEEGSITNTTVYMDYKPVDGILFPHKLIADFAGQEMELKVKELTLNDKLGDVFEK